MYAQILYTRPGEKIMRDMTIMRTPNKKIYAKRGIFLLLATNRG